MRHYLLEDNRLLPSKKDELLLFSDPKSFAIATPDELRKIPDISKVNEYTIRECLNGSQHARLDCHPEYSYGVLSSVEIAEDRAFSVEFRFYLTASSLLLVTRGGNKLVERFLTNLADEEFLQKYDSVTPQTLIIALMEEVIHSNEHHLEIVEDGIEDLEERVLAEAKREYSKVIVEKRRLILHLKHHIEPMLYVIQAFADNENKLFSPMEAKAMKILANKAAGMVSNVLMLRDYATHVREAFQAEHDIKSNDIMKVFTVVTSIFLPLTLIAGWYGMNFKYMPELSWQYGYLYVSVFSIMVVLGSVYLIKQKKWL